MCGFKQYRNDTFVETQVYRSLVDNLKHENRIYIYGKPGSGKTTLLLQLLSEKKDDISFCDCTGINAWEIFKSIYEGIRKKFNFPIMAYNVLGADEIEELLKSETKTLIENNVGRASDFILLIDSPWSNSEINPQEFVNELLPILLDFPCKIVMAGRRPFPPPSFIKLEAKDVSEKEIKKYIDTKGRQLNNYKLKQLKDASYGNWLYLSYIVHDKDFFKFQKEGFPDGLQGYFLDVWKRLSTREQNILRFLAFSRLKLTKSYIENIVRENGAEDIFDWEKVLLLVKESSDSTLTIHSELKDFLKNLSVRLEGGLSKEDLHRKLAKYIDSKKDYTVANKLKVMEHYLETGKGDDWKRVLDIVKEIIYCPGIIAHRDEFISILCRLLAGTTDPSEWDTSLNRGIIHRALGISYYRKADPGGWKNKAIEYGNACVRHLKRAIGFLSKEENFEGKLHLAETHCDLGRALLNLNYNGDREINYSESEKLFRQLFADPNLNQGENRRIELSSGKMHLKLNKAMMYKEKEPDKAQVIFKDGLKIGLFMEQEDHNSFLIKNEYNYVRFQLLVNYGKFLLDKTNPDFAKATQQFTEAESALKYDKFEEWVKQRAIFYQQYGRALSYVAESEDDWNKALDKIGEAINLFENLGYKIGLKYSLDIISKIEERVKYSNYSSIKQRMNELKTRLIRGGCEL